MVSSKVFCLGFQKTGTTSLAQALELLGYSVCGYWPFRDLADYAQPDLADVMSSRVDTLAQQYDAFKDTPWPLYYREMDKRYPGSKFILVTRNVDSWIKSAVVDFSDWPNAIHNHIYGVPYPKGNELAWIERYERHNAEVIDYFQGRPDFIHLHLNNGDVNWENLCGFLGHEVPDQPWPYKNSRARKQSRQILKRIKKKLLTLAKP